MPVRSKYATLDALIIGALSQERMTRARLYTRGAGGHIFTELMRIAGSRAAQAQPREVRRQQAALTRRLQSLRNRGWVARSTISEKWYTRSPEGAR